MATWINFAELRARVSLSDVIFRYYGITTLKRDGQKLVGPCPVHGGDSPRAFHADLDKNVWHCFSGCKKGGNQLDFVAAKDGISIREAAICLQDFFLKGPASPAPAAAAASTDPQPRESDTTALITSSPAPPTATDKPTTTNEPLDFTLELKGDHPHLTEGRKLLPDTIATFGIGYCSRGILRGMIAIPVHNEDGKLIAYAGRRLKPADIDSFGKYKFPKGFHKEQVLYNLHRAKLDPSRSVVLVEGFFSVMKLHEAGVPNVVASMGCELSEAQAGLLRTFSEITVLYDGNDAGWSGSEKVREQLGGHLPVRIVRLPKGIEPEDLPPKALRWLFNGLRALNIAELSFAFAPSAASVAA